MSASRISGLGAATAAALAIICAPSVAQVSVTALVSDDQAAHPAKINDPGLVNGWGACGVGAWMPIRVLKHRKRLRGLNEQALSLDRLNRL